MATRPSKLPIIIVTGASGFVGRYFLEAAKEDFYIYAVARRSLKESGLSPHPNIVWNRLDIADENKVQQLLDDIGSKGGADYFLHFAAFYDFNNREDPEYERTNVQGTEYILKYCKNLGLTRFLFSSTLTVTEFKDPRIILTEKSPADANFPYARTKRYGEILVKKYSRIFPSLVVRQAAIYSDWGEYQPLNAFLAIWLSSRWNCRLLAGHGRTAVPYLHVYDLVNFYLSCIKQTEKIPRFKILIASPNKTTSHRELFEIATKHKYFESARPYLIPKSITGLGIFLKYFIGNVFNRFYFEKPWMIKYIDTDMKVNASFSAKLISWQPTPRYDIRRRLLFLIANMKSDSYEWRYRNEIRPYKAIKERKYLVIYEALISYTAKIIKDILEKLMAEKNKEKFPTYRTIGMDKLIFRVGYLYKILENSLKTGDRTNLIDYAKKLAKERYDEGFSKSELNRAVQITGESIVEMLSTLPQLKDLKFKINDEIMLSIQIIIDQIDDTYDHLVKLEFDKHNLNSPYNAIYSNAINR